MTQPQLAPHYRVTGTLIPVLTTDESDQALIAAAPMEVDAIVRSTHPDFPARAALWAFALAGVVWRWERPPEVTREGEEDFVSELERALPEWLRQLGGGEA